MKVHTIKMKKYSFRDARKMLTNKIIAPRKTSGICSSKSRPHHSSQVHGPRSLTSDGRHGTQLVFYTFYCSLFTSLGCYYNE